jgi:hypothetical protein
MSQSAEHRDDDEQECESENGERNLGSVRSKVEKTDVASPFVVACRGREIVIVAMVMRDLWYANVAMSIHVHMQATQLKSEQTQARDACDRLQHSTHFFSIHVLRTESAGSRTKTRGAGVSP